MNLSFLVILIFVVLFYIIRQHKKDCIECNIRFIVVLGIVLGLYESYMYLSYKKLNSGDLLNENDLKIKDS